MYISFSLVSTIHFVSAYPYVSMKKNKTTYLSEECTKSDLMAVKDALEVLNGRWKLQILISLLNGTKRFKEIAHDIEGISDRMLSKELKDLEQNQLISRTVYDAFPPVVEYAPTDHTKSLHDVIHALKAWGYLHRRKIIGGPPLPGPPPLERSQCDDEQEAKSLEPQRQNAG